MKKACKFFALLLITAIIAGCFTGTTVLAEGTSSNSDFEIDNGGVLTQYYGKGGKVIIPNNVANIGNKAFSKCSEITSITIPDSVVSIEDHAFSECTGLTSITIPNSVIRISNFAFSGCTNLTGIQVNSKNDTYSSENGVLFSKDKSEICLCPIGFPKKSYVIPSSVTSIDAGAFYGCDKLTNITIPNSVIGIGDAAFDSCISLASIPIPNRVTSIGDYAFSGCTSLTSISIPSSVTSIGFGAFSGCNNLSNITIPKSVTSIGGGAFRNTKWLTDYSKDFVVVNGLLLTYKGNSPKVIIPNEVTKVNDSAFSECLSLTDVTIPDSVTDIGSFAFWGCDKLTNINIPNSVTSIGNQAFSGCGIKSIIIPKSVTKIESAFNKNITIIGDEGSAAQTYANENGITFQLADAVSNSSTSSTASIASAPIILATAETGGMGLNPVSLAVILIGIALIAVCVFLTIKKRNTRKQPIQQAPQSPLPPEYPNSERLPMPLEQPAPVISSPAEIICMQCGRSCPSEALFCPNCGRKIKK